ncbi:MAG: toxin ParE1/3/4 [Saprospiraceae bacterium]|jgi:toxin ParE1/3/4
MKLGFELSKLALKDIDSIWNYTAEHWSPIQANIYYNQIFEVIDLVCSNPEIGKSIKDVKAHHRSIIAKSHMIIYKIDKEKILIDRILQQRMDIESQLGK